MKTKILIGTNNKDKLKQFLRIFENLNADVELLSLKDFGITDDVEEDSDNLLDNAKKKAKCYGGRSKILTLADDTGLFVDVLNGEPGLHSKRWHLGTDKDRYIKVLERMKNIPKGKRTCRYTGVLAVYNPKTKGFWTYQDSLEGRIADEPVEANGFGYDSIFICLEYNKYYSQLADTEIDAISHRGLGIKELVQLLNANEF